MASNAWHESATCVLRDRLSTATGVSAAASATNVAVLARLRPNTAVRARFGYRRLHILLEREGLVVNHKRVHRIYRATG